MRQYTHRSNDCLITYDYPKDRFELVMDRESITSVGNEGVRPPDGVGRIVSLIVSPTSRCNSRCDYCFADHYDDGDLPLTVEDFHNLGKAASTAGILRLDFSGGEPLLRKDLLRVIETVLPFAGVVVTSAGQLLRKNIARTLASMIPMIQVSLDGHLDAMNRPRHLKASKIIRSIQTCIDCGMNIRVLTVAHKYNFPLLLDFGRFLHELGVWEWKVIRVVSAGRASTWNGLLDDSEAWRLYHELKTSPLPTQLVGFQKEYTRLCVVLEDNLHLVVDRDGIETDLGLIDRQDPFAGLSKLTAEDTMIHLNYYLNSHSRGRVLF